MNEPEDRTVLRSTTFQATVIFLLLHVVSVVVGAPLPEALTMTAIVGCAGKEAAGKLRRG